MITSLVIFIALSCLGFAIGISRLRKREWNVFDPVVAFWIGFAVYYGVGNVWFCMELVGGGYYSSGGFEFDPSLDKQLSQLVEVAILAACYGATVALGMFGPVGRLLSAASRPVASRVSAEADLPLRLVAPIAAMNWLQQFGLMPSGGLAWPSIVAVIPSACSLALNAKLSFVAASRQSKIRLAAALGVAALSSAAGASTGSKQALLMPLVAAFGGFILGIRRPWPIIAAIAVSLPAFVGLEEWNKSLRSLIWTPDSNHSYAERIAALGDAAALAIQDYEAQSSLGDLSRLCTAIPMMQTMESIRRGQGISAMDALVIPHVPRAIWPGKPQVLVGEVLYEQFSGNPGGSHSSPGQPAEAFMYGGWLGLVAIGAIMGCLATVASAIIARLWAARQAAALGTLSLITINFGKSENWLWAYVPSVVGCVAILVTLKILARALETPWFNRGGRRLIAKDVRLRENPGLGSFHAGQ